MLNKRGQVTLMIIIAVVIVAIILLIVFLRISFLRRDARIEAERIRRYIQYSLRENTEITLFLIGAQGGYIDPGEPYYTYEGIKIAYWYYNESYFYPNLTEIQEEINNFISLNIPTCEELNNKWRPLTITCGKVEVETQINEENVSVKLKYPLTLKKGNTIINLDPEYNHYVKIKLKQIYEGAIETLYNYGCLDCLEEIFVSKDLYLYQFEEEKVRFITIEQRNVKILNSSSYILNFAIQK